MSATIFSLISGHRGAFAALVIWVYSPSRRDRIEALGLRYPSNLTRMR